jgi:ABC-type transport system involved in multi-copper enzyme maturation permease subunit
MDGVNYLGTADSCDEDVLYFYLPASIISTIIIIIIIIIIITNMYSSEFETYSAKVINNYPKYSNELRSQRDKLYLYDSQV